MKLIPFLFIAMVVLLAACTKEPSRIDDGFLGGITLSLNQSSLTSSATTLAAGNSTTVTLSVKDQNGNAFYIPNTNPVVVFSNSGGTSTGTFSSVTNFKNGTFTSTFTGATAGTATSISATVDGATVDATTNVQVTAGTISLSNSYVTLSSANVISGSSITATLHAYDTLNNTLTSGGLTVTFSRSGGTSTGSFSAVTDHGDGTYSANFTGAAAGTATSISASIGGQAITSTLPTVTVNPAGPSAFTISSAVAGASNVVLSWGAASGAVTYAVKYGTTTGVYGTTFSSNATSPTTITGLTPGTTYYFMVTATNALGSTDATSQAVATPLAAFTISSATVNTSSTVRLTWAASTGATGYTVKYGTTSGSYGTTFSTSATSPTDVTGLTPGTIYYFMVTAVNSSGSANATAEASATPLSAFTITSTTSGSRSAAVAWASATGATSYDTLYATSSGLISGTYGSSSVGATSGDSVTGLTVGSTYYFRVRANGSNGSVLSTNELSATIAATISISPTSVTLLKGDSYQFSSTGSAPLAYSDAGSGFMSTVTGFYDSLVSFVSSSEAVTLTKTDSGETASATVTFRNFAAVSTYAPTYNASFVANKVIRVGTSLYAAGSALGWWIVRKSTDDGVTWTIVDQYRLSSNDVLRSDLGNNEARDIAAKGTDLYVVGSSFGGTANNILHWIVRKSADSGATWTTVDDFSLAAGKKSRANGIYTNTNDIYVVGMAHDSSDKRNSVVRKSTDNGASFGANLSTSELSVSSNVCQEFNTVASDGVDIVVGGYKSGSSCSILSASYGNIMNAGVSALAYRYNGAAWSVVTNSTGAEIRSMTKLGTTLYVAHGNYSAGSRSKIYVSTYSNGVLSNHSQFNLNGGTKFTFPYEINNDGTNLFVLGSGTPADSRNKGLLLTYNTGASAWQLLPAMAAYDSGQSHTEFHTGVFYGTKIVILGRTGTSVFQTNNSTQREATLLQNGGFQFISTDTGSSFSAVSYQNIDVPNAIQDPVVLSFGNYVYEFSFGRLITSTSYLRRSSDGGATWVVLSSLPTGFANPRIDDAGNIYGLIESSGTLTTWKSTNNASSFSSQSWPISVSNGGCGAYYLEDYFAAGGTIYFNMSVQIDDCTLSLGANQYLLKSSDDGISFTSTDLGSTGVASSFLRKIGNNHLLRVSTEGSFESFDNGTTWSSSTLPNANFVNLNMDTNGQLVAIYEDTTAKTWVVRKSTDSGSTWSLSDTFQNTSGLQSSPKVISFSNDHSVFIVGKETNTNGVADKVLVRKLGAGSSSWRTVESYQEVAGQVNSASSISISASGNLMYSARTFFTSMIEYAGVRLVQLP